MIHRASSKKYNRDTSFQSFYNANYFSIPKLIEKNCMPHELLNKMWLIMIKQNFKINYNHSK